MSKTDELVFRIQEMRPGEIRKKRTAVESYLSDRSPLVRCEAAQALARARVGSAAVRGALRRERDELVLDSLCDAAVQSEDRESVSLLRKLCRHSSWLVRKAAVWAVAELEEAKSVSFLRRLLRREKSRRVQAVLQAALFQWGADEVLPALLRNLQSRDYLVRCITANALRYDVKRRARRHDVLAALREALAREETVAAGEAIENAVARWATSSGGAGPAARK